MANTASSTLPCSDLLPYMPLCTRKLESITIEDIQNDSEHFLCFRACIWQARVALELLSKQKNYVVTAATGSGKTFTFWVPKLYKMGLTIIIVPLKMLGEQLAEESSMAGFKAVNVTAKSLGDSLELIKVLSSFLNMRCEHLKDMMIGNMCHAIQDCHPLSRTHIRPAIHGALD